MWLESVDGSRPAEELWSLLDSLRHHLEPYGFSESLALYPSGDDRLPKQSISDVDNIVEGDILIDFAYGDCSFTSPERQAQVIKRFRSSALIDIDPGLTQLWMQSGGMKIAPHDFYLTIGETIDRGLPYCGLEWLYIPPCVALEWWPVTQTPVDSPFTTVTNWWGEWMSENGVAYDNSKRAGFLPYLDLPKLTNISFELALPAGTNESELRNLVEHGWSVLSAQEVVSTPWDYQRYIQSARGEFSCAKPLYRRLQNAWISDRTLCYLATGRPAVVQHTGESHVLPEAEGLCRFKNLPGAITALRAVESNYDHHSRAARALAEEFFDAKKVASKLLEYVV
jgi:hypothetical protein